jgi:hypothetical protein
VQREAPGAKVTDRELFIFISARVWLDLRQVKLHKSRMRAARNAGVYLICWLALLLRSEPQTPTSNIYRLIFQNGYVEVFDLELQSDRQAPIHDNSHNLVWIALSAAMVEVQARNADPRQFQLDAGDVRLFGSHQIRSLVNKTHSVIHAVVVDLREHLRLQFLLDSFTPILLSACSGTFVMHATMVREPSFL